MTGDLFGKPLLPGLAYCEDLLEPGEQADLLRRVAALDLVPFRFQGWVGKRLTCSFGWRYDFDAARFEPAREIPDWLQPVRDRAAAFAGVEAEEFVHALVTRYDPGAGIGWHRDRPQFDKVVGLSLGAPAMLRFRRRTDQGFERFALPLSPGSAYLLDGAARSEWEHGIAGHDALRFAITFRSLSDKGRAAASAPPG